jgi:hypothetical protein
MNIPILQSSQVLRKHNFISVEEFYLENKKKWIDMSQLSSFYDVPNIFNHLISNLSGEGEVKHLTRLYDGKDNSVMRFFAEVQGTKESILAKGRWGKGYTYNSNLVAFDEDGSIVEPHYTEFKYIVENGAVSRLSSQIQLNKIEKIEYVGRFSYLQASEPQMDAFVVTCCAGKVLETTKHLILGDLNDCIFRDDE